MRARVEKVNVLGWNNSISTFDIPSTIVDELKLSDTPYFYGNMFRKSTNPSISDIDIVLVNLFNGTSWHDDLARSLIVYIYHSMIPIR